MTLWVALTMIAGLAIGAVARQPKELLITLVMNGLAKFCTVALLLGVTDIAVPWRTMVLDTVLYVVLPLVVGFLTRSILRNAAQIDALFRNRVNRGRCRG